MADIKIIARPWQPQDLIDDLQEMIDEESDNYLNTRKTTLCMAKSFLEEHFAYQKWIPVTERLPETDKKVLCYKKGEIKIGKYLNAKYTDEIYAFRSLDMTMAFGATHWMPLPEPPKE